MATIEEIEEIFSTLSITELRENRNRNITKIQALWRGYKTRKKLRKIRDKLTYKRVMILLENFTENNRIIKEMNEELLQYSNYKEKPIRNTNIPSDVSENIAKLAIRKAKNICPRWDRKPGDLRFKNRQIEVKCFSSTGPSSFGPTEKWDILCFVDAMDYQNLNFKVYLITLSNIEFGRIRFSNTETYAQQCARKVRPRNQFAKIKTQLNPREIRLIFDGYISQLK